ncbi:MULTISPECIES: LCP family protein [unclassified Nonomuraea]|uniref:LCP family protein n=1 Tax=unclassified Nonomuraea TaxID=2593643 RepID=UPI0033F18E20
MDDMKLLRDLGAALEHEPPATLARQRNRLTQARPRRRRISLLLTGLAAVATAAAVAVPTLVLRGHQTVPPPAGARPAKVTGALNVLLVGTDGKAGSERFQAQKGSRTDTMILLHLPADRKKIIGVSFPRDSMVRIPACGDRPARRDMINSAFSTGGLTCVVETVETLTKVRIDHMAEVDFDAFKDVVDALGGVEVTLREPVDDKASKLKLPAGKSIVNGEQALAYARLRRYGDGSDLQRIKRQQVLVTAMLAKARKTLDDPAKVRAFLAAATKSVKTDEGLDLETMVGIASSVEKSRPTLVTVPWQPDPKDPNRIVWKQPEANQLFETLR